MTTRSGIDEGWKAQGGVMERRWIPNTAPSGLRAWTSWVCQRLKGAYGCCVRSPTYLTFVLVHRTGVRAAIDWLFIRVQNSRRLYVPLFLYEFPPNSLTLGTTKAAVISGGIWFCCSSGFGLMIISSSFSWISLSYTLTKPVSAAKHSQRRNNAVQFRLVRSFGHSD